MDKKKVLLVEDELFIRDLYTEALNSASYDVISAVNGQEAYDKLKANTSYDLILLDIVMPVMYGIEVIKKLKQEGVTVPQNRLVFLTNSDNEDDIKQSLQLGCGYIIKSQVTPGDLLNEIKHFIEQADATSNKSAQ